MSARQIAKVYGVIAALLFWLVAFARQIRQLGLLAASVGALAGLYQAIKRDSKQD